MNTFCWRKTGTGQQRCSAHKEISWPRWTSLMLLIRTQWLRKNQEDWDFLEAQREAGHCGYIDGLYKEEDRKQEQIMEQQQIAKSRHQKAFQEAQDRASTVELGGRASSKEEATNSSASSTAIASAVGGCSAPKISMRGTVTVVDRTVTTTLDRTAILECLLHFQCHDP